MDNKLYWSGNSAKTKILREILGKLSDDRPTIIFDYGCGDGGDWPLVLRDYPQIRLIGYEPHDKSFAMAKKSLQGLNVELYTGKDIDKLDFKADFIVSFSVLEHVYDRYFYLQTARKLLAYNGLFYLNYDDGHFRNFLDLNRPGHWFGQLKEWLHNLLAGPSSWIGITSGYQQRIHSQELENLVRETGFEIGRSEYSNLVSFKQLQKTLPEELLQEFSVFWLEVEEKLNNRFHLKQQIFMGDSANLWQQMGSITYTLSLSGQDMS
jgi:SAM-dependent methyltransferase